ncbi:thyrostimulin beta-5 subunit [Lingula anatina]|uniref:Thyrostimulin beta-5 subunit n=1 Tax=Lingula anatina TaxID=7574 RepID=A0A1S3IRF4_LINAN|nr:thyrostimulin beta-5 subunit [Lingula anatina]|eukprot:XP_013400795.1 thyrostimulin beta-5 subunit [Lingula anatina]
MELPAALISILPILWTLASGSVDPKTMLACNQREFRYNVEKPPYVAPDGTTITCKGTVKVWACYGRCETSEVGDYEFPFKLSFHNVCTYGGDVVRRRVTLDCPGYPDPTVELFDVERCECQVCRYDKTSCENI